MAELPIAPGQVYIEVDYDYEYKAKERLISIHQGECYLLVRKTNNDWWQVKKEEGSKAFYVPAQYVREVRKALMPPPKPLSLHLPAVATGNAPTREKPSVLKLEHPGESLHRRSPSGRCSPPNQRHDPGSPTEHKRDTDILLHVPQGGQRGGCNTLPRVRAHSPELNHSDSAGDSLDPRNESESGDELSSSSTEHLQTQPGLGRADSPVYTNLQELKSSQSSQPPAPLATPLHIQGDWETHKDASGRHFFYNHSTQERTWKPPRAMDSSTGSSSEWIKHVDEQGRPYYYSADGSRSEWDLPKPTGDSPKSRSLDWKVEPIILTKWRHSTYNLEPNDKDAPPGFKTSSAETDSCPSSPKPPSSPYEKCGVLNVTKITEHGKKVRKNWTSSWTVLQGSLLLFAKGQGGGASWFGGGQSKPEFTVDLKGGSVDWASKEKSSKKHVIELKTRQGTELLIQSDDAIINEWYRALQDTISTHVWESDEVIEENMPESPGDVKYDKEQERRCSKKGRAIKMSTSMDAAEAQKKTKHKLKKFLTRRPTLQAVRDKGYIKDQVFGCGLSSLCHRENSTVPSFVKMCIDHVENTGLCVDGLYRVSGNLAIIQKLRFAVNHDEMVNLADGKWEDIHVTTGALKMYFRELPEPLFTYGLFHDFVNGIKNVDYTLRVQSVRDLVRQLPKPNHDTMQVLFKHLRKVIDHGEENRMTTQGVAIVFGPTLLRPETETWNMAVHMVYQNQIVELILLEYESIFGR